MSNTVLALLLWYSYIFLWEKRLEIRTLKLLNYANSIRHSISKDSIPPNISLIIKTNIVNVSKYLISLHHVSRYCFIRSPSTASCCVGAVDVSSQVQEAIQWRNSAILNNHWVKNYEFTTCLFRMSLSFTCLWLLPSFSLSIILYLFMNILLLLFFLIFIFAL